MKKRDIILAVGGLAFILLVVSLVLLLGDHFKTLTCGCPKVISQNYVYLFVFLAVIFVGSLFYYLFSLKIDSQKCIINKNIEILFSILDDDEKKVIKKIVSGNGSIMQNEVSKDFGKIKSHRIIKKLLEKKIIDIKRDGKTNQIILKEELRQELIR